MEFEGQPELVVEDAEAGNGVFCMVCGSTPAMQVSFRAHRGLLVAMQFRKQEGEMCRDCGIAVFRTLQGDSLWQGWWGWLSALINPFVLLLNLAERYQISKLAAPLPGAPYAPLDPGRPLTRRPHILGLLLPVAAIVGLIALAGQPPTNPSQDRAYPSPTYPSHPSYPAYPGYLPPGAGVGTTAPTSSAAPGVGAVRVGECVLNRNGSLDTDSEPRLEIVGCDDPAAQARVLARTVTDIGDSFCMMHDGTDVVYTESRTGGPSWTYGFGELTLCLQQLW